MQCPRSNNYDSRLTATNEIIRNPELLNSRTWAGGDHGGLSGSADSGTGGGSTSLSISARAGRVASNSLLVFEKDRPDVIHGDVYGIGDTRN